MPEASSQAAARTGQTRRQLLLGGATGLVGAGTLAWAGPATGQARPITMVVPFPAGALTDSLGRAVAEQIGQATGVPVVVENRPGAGTLLGASFVARQPPDGNTLLTATSTTLGIAPAMQANPAAKPENFTPIALLGDVRLYLVCAPGLPVRNLAEMVAAVRARPGAWNYASPGIGTVHHLLMEMIKTRENLSLTHVPYRGSMQALTDLLTERVQLMFLDASVVVPQLEAGALRALAVSGTTRRAATPQVPALTEAWPDISQSAWQAIVGPADMPEPLVLQLNGIINRALADPRFAASLDAMGLEPRPRSPAELVQLIKEDGRRWAELVQHLGLRS